MLSANGRGTLVVRTWHEPNRGMVVIEVNDDGPGVPEELQTKIFDPFFTTKEVGKGTGLGLTVAYAIVHEHGGRICLESVVGRGASFFVELPTGEMKLPRPVPAPSEFAEAVPTGAAVLVVEDEPALAAAVAEGLADAGFVVDRAGDGEEALARVPRSGLRPDRVRSEDAARGRHALLPDHRRGQSVARAPRDLRHGRCGRHRLGAAPEGGRLPLAGEAIPAGRLAPGGARGAGVGDYASAARGNQVKRVRFRLTGRLRPADRRHVGRHCLSQPLHRPGVQLRHPGLVDSQLRPDLLHRHVTEVVERDQSALAGGKRPDSPAHPLAQLGAGIGLVGRIGLGGHERGGQRCPRDVVSSRQG